MDLARFSKDTKVCYVTGSKESLPFWISGRLLVGLTEEMMGFCTILLSRCQVDSELAKRSVEIIDAFNKIEDDINYPSYDLTASQLVKLQMSRFELLVKLAQNRLDLLNNTIAILDKMKAEYAKDGKITL